MTRTTDPDPMNAPPLPPLGPPIERRNPNNPVQPNPRRRRDDDLPAGIERGPDGRLRTNIPVKW